MKRLVHSTKMEASMGFKKCMSEVTSNISFVISVEAFMAEKTNMRLQKKITSFLKKQNKNKTMQAVRYS